MNDTIYGAFIGCGATLAGTALTLAYQAFKDYQKDKAILSVAKAKTQQTCTKKLLHWLQKMHSKIQHSSSSPPSFASQCYNMYYRTEVIL